MNVCKYMQPEQIEVKPGHRVACHLYNREIMDNLSKYDAEYEEILAKERAEEEAKKQKKTFKKVMTDFFVKVGEKIKTFAKKLSEKTKALIERINEKTKSLIKKLKQKVNKKSCNEEEKRNEEGNK